MSGPGRAQAWRFSRSKSEDERWDNDVPIGTRVGSWQDIERRQPRDQGGSQLLRVSCSSGLQCFCPNLPGLWHELANPASASKCLERHYLSWRLTQGLTFKISVHHGESRHPYRDAKGIDFKAFARFIGPTPGLTKLRH